MKKAMDKSEGYAALHRICAVSVKKYMQVQYILSINVWIFSIFICIWMKYIQLQKRERETPCRQAAKKAALLCSVHSKMQFCLCLKNSYNIHRSASGALEGNRLQSNWPEPKNVMLLQIWLWVSHILGILKCLIWVISLIKRERS